MIKSKITFLQKFNPSIVVIIILPFLFFIKPLIHGDVLYWGTTSSQFFPWMDFAISEIFKGHLPLWNPYNGWGAPFIANYQSAIFYPLNWIIFLVYTISSGNNYFWIYTLLLVLHLQIGGVGFYKLISKFGLSETSKILGAVVFMFCGYLMARINFISMIWAAVWFPWIIMGVVEIFEFSGRKKRFVNLSIVVALSMQLFSGHAQTAYYSLLFSTLLFLVLWIKTNQKKNALIRLFVSFFLSFAIAAIQLIPTAEYLLNSQRSKEVPMDYALNFSLWPWRLLSIIFPDFWGNPNFVRYIGGGNYWEDHLYLGVFPLVFIVFAVYLLIRNKVKSTEVNLLFFRFNLVMFPISLIFALGKNFYVFPFFYRFIPSFDMFQAPSRFIFWTSFCGAVLCAYGFEQWKTRSLPPRKIGVFIFIFLAIFLGVAVGNAYMDILPDSVVYSVIVGCLMTILFGGMSIIKNYVKQKYLKYFAFGIIVVVFLDLYSFNAQPQLFISKDFYSGFAAQNKTYENGYVFIEKKSEEFLKYNQLFRFDRFHQLRSLETNDFLFLPNTNMFSDPYYMVNNFDPFVPDRYSKFTEAVGGLNLTQQKTVLSKLGVAYFVSENEDQSGNLLIEQFNDVNIVHWYDCFQSSAPDTILNDFLVSLQQPESDVCQLSDTEIQINQKEIDLPQTPVQINLISPSTNELKFSYESKNAGFVTLNQTWYPGWKAILDDTSELKIYQADYLFSGLNLPKGKHSVQLIYDPLSFKIGLGVSLIGMIFFVLLIMHKKFEI